MFVQPYRYRSSWREMERLRRELNSLVAGLEPLEGRCDPGIPGYQRMDERQRGRGHGGVARRRR